MNTRIYLSPATRDHQQICLSDTPRVRVVWAAVATPVAVFGVPVQPRGVASINSQVNSHGAPMRSCGRHTKRPARHACAWRGGAHQLTCADAACRCSHPDTPRLRAHASAFGVQFRCRGAALARRARTHGLTRSRCPRSGLGRRSIRARSSPRTRSTQAPRARPPAPVRRRRKRTG